MEKLKRDLNFCLQSLSVIPWEKQLFHNVATLEGFAGAKLWEKNDKVNGFNFGAWFLILDFIIWWCAVVSALGHILQNADIFTKIYQDLKRFLSVIKSHVKTFLTMTKWIRGVNLATVPVGELILINKQQHITACHTPCLKAQVYAIRRICYSCHILKLLNR